MTGTLCYPPPTLLRVGMMRILAAPVNRKVDPMGETVPERDGKAASTFWSVPLTAIRARRPTTDHTGVTIVVEVEGSHPGCQGRYTFEGPAWKKIQREDVSSAAPIFMGQRGLLPETESGV
jgi:hypothetical protein